MNKCKCPHLASGRIHGCKFARANIVDGKVVSWSCFYDNKDKKKVPEGECPLGYG